MSILCARCILWVYWLVFSSQVTIEVVDDPQMEVEMDLAKENEWLPSSSSSPSSTVDWLGGKKLFWPLFWTYTDTDSSEDSNSRSGGEETGEEEQEDYLIDYGSEEHILSGVGGDWDTHWNEGWDPVQSYYGKLGQEIHSLCSYSYSAQNLALHSRVPFIKERKWEVWKKKQLVNFSRENGNIRRRVRSDNWKWTKDLFRNGAWLLSSQSERTKRCQHARQHEQSTVRTLRFWALWSRHWSCWSQRPAFWRWVQCAH